MLLNILTKQPRKSIGSSLFMYVLGGALVGLGSMSYFFYRTLEHRATEAILSQLSTEVKTIEAEFAQVEQMMVDLSATLKILKATGVEDATTYEKVAFEFFQTRSPLTMGVGFGQESFMLAGDRDRYWPYFFVDQSSPEQVGAPLAPPNAHIRYVDVFAVENYSDLDYYQLPIKAQKGIWLEPFEWYGLTLTNHTAPVFNADNELLAVIGLDISVTALTESMVAPQNWGEGYFAMLSQSGNVLAYPPDPEKVKAVATYKDIPALQVIWQRMNAQEVGVFQSNGSYWAYQQVDGPQWLMIASVPQWVVLGPVLAISVGAASAVGSVLALVVILFVRRLNSRLNPILEECRKLSVADDARSRRLDQTKPTSQNTAILAFSSQNADELDILEQSFNQMTIQLKESFDTLERRVEERTAELKQAKEVADAAN
ncbi:MAG: histidine kinase, partial [Cyanobacteria bacterium P01_F01_bin.150]